VLPRTALQDSDLVVLDFAVNDGHISPPGRDRQGYAFSGGARRGFEQLLRKSLKLRAQPAVALLHFFSWNATRDKVEVGGSLGGWGEGAECEGCPCLAAVRSQVALVHVPA
jgi:hypothetical protein